MYVSGEYEGSARWSNLKSPAYASARPRSLSITAIVPGASPPLASASAIASAFHVLPVPAVPIRPTFTFSCLRVAGLNSSVVTILLSWPGEARVPVVEVHGLALLLGGVEARLIPVAHLTPPLRCRLHPAPPSTSASRRQGRRSGWPRTAPPFAPAAASAA